MEYSVNQWLGRGGRGSADVRITQPVQLNCWTKESSKTGGKYNFGDTSGLHTISKVPLPVDLNDGYPDSYTRKDDDENTPVDPIIQAAESARVDWEGVDVCSFRNNLNKVALTPISPDQPWVVDACLINTTMFLNIHKTPDSMAQHADSDRFTYYGYKFEAVCTNSEEVDSTSEFATLVTFTLGGLKVVMGAEIDCHDGSYHKQAGEEEGQVCASFLELKTYRQPDTERQRTNMKRYKYPRWWVQSFLAGVPYLVLGARNDDGMLLDIHRKAVADLPGEARAAGASWHPQALLSCLHGTLSWMRDTAQQHAGEHCRFSYEPAQRRVVCRVQSDSGWPEHLQQLLNS